MAVTVSDHMSTGNLDDTKAIAMGANYKTVEYTPGFGGNYNADGTDTVSATEDVSDNESSTIGQTEAKSSLPHSSDDGISLPNKEWGTDWIIGEGPTVGVWSQTTDPGYKGPPPNLGVLNVNLGGRQRHKRQQQRMQDYITKYLQKNLV